MLWEWLKDGTQVYILDLDGTLMPSAAIDNACFWQAVFDCFDRRGQLPDLHDFKHVSDSGILHEWCVRELGRAPGRQEVAQIKQHFAQLLEAAFLRQPEHFHPLPGVSQWLQAVRKSGHVYAGIATGGWEHSARLKLKLSGLDEYDLPLASSDDAMARTEIMQIAAQRTLRADLASQAVFTYVGDGSWDLKASRELNWGFIGIASGARAGQLRLAGAGIIRKNFSRP